VFKCLCVQVWFPPAKRGEEAAWEVLKDLVRGCLTVDDYERLEAHDVQERLFAFMEQSQWSSDVSAAGL